MEVLHFICLNSQVMKKLILSLCFAVILSGAAFSLYNAANDYGLATISRPPAITAQGDDTSFGGDETPGNPGDCKRPGFICYAKQIELTFCYFTKTDAYGNITLMDGTGSRFLPNTLYDIVEIYIDCQNTGNAADVCDTGKKGSHIKSANVVGDGTN